MKKTMRSVLGMLLVLGLSGTAQVRGADEGQVTEGEAIFGPQWFASESMPNSAKFSEYREVPNGFVLEQFLFRWEPKTGYFLDLSARDVSQLDQRLGLEFGKRDLWKFHFNWTENPRQWTDEAHQLFAYRGSGVFTLADTFQSAVQAAPATADTSPADGEWDAGTKGAIVKDVINSSADDIRVGYQRQLGEVGIQFTPTRNWTFSLDAQRERRGGTIPQSLGMYFALQPAEVAAPVNFETDFARVGAEYSNRSWNVGGQVTVSQFDTGIDSITWDDQLFLNDVPINANSARPGRGRLTPWSNSDMWKWVVYGGVNFGWHSRLNATYSQSETTQDDPFLPMTINDVINTTLNPSPLPARSLDGKYEDNLGEVVLSSRPLSWFRFKAWFRDFNHDNKSPSLVFADYVSTDFQFPLCGNANACGATTNRIARRSLPYSYEQTNLGANLGFTPLDWLDVTAGYEREQMDREFSAVEKSDEDIFKLALDFQVTDWLAARVTGKHQERRADHYDPEYFLESFPIGEAVIAAANEGLRKFIWTDRDRDLGSLLVEVSPKPTWSIYAEAAYAKDEYLDPETGKKIGESETILEDRNFDTVDETYEILLAGRVDDRITAYTLGGTLSPNPRFGLYADYTREDREYSLASRYRAPVGGIGSDDPLDNWGSDAQDKYNTATLGFNADLTKDRRWRLNGNLSRSVGKGDISTDFVPGGNPNSDTTLTKFPQVKTTLSIAQLMLDRAIKDNLDVGLRYWFEKWDEDNFASDFNRPYMGDPDNDAGSRESIFLGLDFKDYTNHILGFLVRYRFR